MNESRCTVRGDDGTTCGDPATIADRQRGGTVCLEHAEDKPALH